MNRWLENHIYLHSSIDPQFDCHCAVWNIDPIALHNSLFFLFIFAICSICLPFQYRFACPNGLLVISKYVYARVHSCLLCAASIVIYYVMKHWEKCLQRFNLQFHWKISAFHFYFFLLIHTATLIWLDWWTLVDIMLMNSYRLQMCAVFVLSA